MKRSDQLTPAPPDYKWPLCPDADRFIRERLAEFLQGHAFARRLAERMRTETSTEFQAWVDHLILPKRRFSALLAPLGFVPDKQAKSRPGTVVFWHPFADLPRLVLTTKSPAASCAVMVDGISDFLLAHGLSLPVEGAPLGRYREARIAGEQGELRIIERRGTRAVVPDDSDRAAKIIRAVEAWSNRPRDSKNGMKHALQLAKKLAASLGTGPAAWAFLEAERHFWQRKNRAGQVQKQRQDRLGLGWGNHDHHTFRSSRAAFAALIKILVTFGFKKRERYYAGAEAGWGAQIMEQPEARLVIFADVDLTPAETTVDFSSVPLPESPKPGTVGLWCALHGDSMLAGGMHHLECKFDYEHLREALKTSGVNVMKPFSDFPHLRQAFTEGESWPVPVDRLEALRASGWLSPDAFERIKQNGAVGSHMENLQRRDGFKGFNQRGVSDIIRAVNPELQAMKRAEGGA